MAPIYPDVWNTWTGTWTGQSTIVDSTSTGTSNTSGGIWLTWTQTSATTTTNLIWDNWTGTGMIPVSFEPQVLSEEEVAARAERQRLATARLNAAKERARALLVACLEERQREELERDGYFHVETRNGTRRYRLKPGAAPVRVHGEDGERWSYCIHPDYGFPADDVVLAQKLLIEADEDEFLRIANASRLAGSLR